MRVSVVIPTLNAGPSLAGLLERLRAQQPCPPDEIVIVDSGSSDDTCQQAAAAGARIVKWNEPYNHGLVRDAGISAATGDIVFLTVQDALPAGSDWLARLAAHFEDQAVAGATSRQIPPPAGPLELRIKSSLDTQSGAAPVRICLADHPGYAQYPPAQRLELYRFDNVCAALRRAVWEQIPFGACGYAEDLQWARRVLEAGHALIRDPAAPVIHAHSRGFIYEFRRALLDAQVLDEVFDYRYRWRDKLSRAQALVASGERAPVSAGLVARLAAARTYAAHALARAAYNSYRVTLKPF
ncbi:MAG: glycosyltransferase, partial [Planctomycetota bacterium]